MYFHTILVDGKEIKPIRPGLLMIEKVSKPLTITVVYGSQIIWVNIAVITGLIGLIITGYLLYTLIKSREIKKS